MRKEKKKLKRIAFITSSLTVGGAQGNLIHITNYLTQKNVQLDIISLRNAVEFDKKTIKSPHIIYLLNGKYSLSLFNFPFIALIIFFRLSRLILRKKYALLIGTHEYYPFYVTILFSKLFRIKSLLLLGNNMREEFKNKNVLFSLVNKLLINDSYRFSSKLICVSKSLTKDIKNYLQIPSEKIETIYNGVDIEDIQKLSKQKASLKVGKNEQVIAIVGRLIEKKGHKRLLKAFKLVAEANPNVKLLIIGKGKLENNLKKLTHDLKLEKNVIHVGFIKDNPYKYLSRSTIFVFSSLYEGFGNVLIEAMACGLPIISMNAPFGPSEILDNTEYKDHKKIIYGKYGILVPNFSSDKEKLLAEAMITVLRDRKLLHHYKKMSLKRMRDFNAETMGELHYRVITNLIH